MHVPSRSIFDRATNTVPKGGARKCLTEKGRINKLPIRCSMTPSVIRQDIGKAFSEIPGVSKAKLWPRQCTFHCH